MCRYVSINTVEFFAFILIRISSLHQGKNLKGQTSRYHGVVSFIYRGGLSHVKVNAFSILNIVKEHNAPMLWNALLLHIMTDDID